jgi:MFS family permease
VTAAEERVQYRTALANREFAGVLLAQVASDTGDQIARVAIALLVLDRTGSALGAATVFAVTLLPSVIAGPILGPLADRVPRRHLMLIADLVRAGLVALLALLAVAAVPLWILFLLLLITELFTSPFEAARTAMIPDLLRDPAIVATGMGLARSMSFFDQVFGLLLGGAIVQALSPRAALIVDSASFVFSFLVVRLAVKRRAAAVTGGAPTLRVLWNDMREGLSLLLRDRGRRVLVAFAWLMIIPTVAPEAVALAYARHDHASDLWGAALLAAPIAGTALGSLLIGNRSLWWQRSALRGLALAMSLLLLVSWLAPPVGTIWFVWLGAGFFAGFFVSIMALVTLLTPGEHRGRVAAVAGAGLNLVQALAFLGVGYLADRTSPGRAVAVAGVLGVVGVVGLSAFWPNADLRRRIKALSRVVD